MIALIDCNSFFCSVEKVFYPGLEGKPVCVLSSNDGCIVALTPEAKAIGLHRGDPLFKVKDIVKRHDVKIFSSNMQLYAAMSKRVNNILRAAVPHSDVYSIDESFLYLDGLERYHNVEDYMRKIVEKVRLYTDIPVSIGIASTKTLAKIGSKFAKQYKGYRSVCLIDTEEKRRKALNLFKLSDVWGIGAQTLAKLTYLGIRTPLEFADKKENWVRSHFTKPGVQTWKELNGIPCIDTTEVIQRQNICTSRSFGNMVTDYVSLKAAIVHFATGCANKLREQHSLTSTVTVFISSNRYREDLSQYANVQTITLPFPTADTIEITKAALTALQSIYEEGISYKKAGVILRNLSNATYLQHDFFDPIKNRFERMMLMKSIDDLNHRFGAMKVHLASDCDEKQCWHTKSEYRSGNYLSDLHEILTITV